MQWRKDDSSIERWRTGGPLWMRMLSRGQFETASRSMARSISFRRHNPLFHDCVRYDSRNVTVEEIQDPVLAAVQTDPEFVNPVAEEAGFGPP
jgi:hypothetical protein